MARRFPAAQRVGLALRPAGSADAPFLAELYVSTRAGEVAAFGWPPEMQQAFLNQQHVAQHAHYARVYPDAEHWIVEHEGHAIGRLYLAPSDDEVLLVDIALLPEARGQGRGTALLRDVIAGAASEEKRLALHVERTNRARNLYLRLGFELAGDNGIHELMVRPPNPLRHQ